MKNKNKKFKILLLFSFKLIISLTNKINSKNRIKREVPLSLNEKNNIVSAHNQFRANHDAKNMKELVRI